MEEAGVQWGILVPGLLLVAVGGAAYAGLAEQFWRRLYPRTTLGFGILWLGLSGVLSGLSYPILETPLGAVVGAVSLVCFAIAMLSFVWMPQVLQPRWYRRAPGGRR